MRWTSQAGEKAMLRTCRSWQVDSQQIRQQGCARFLTRVLFLQMELFGKLKDEMMSTAALELQNADSLVEEGKLTNSFPVAPLSALP